VDVDSVSSGYSDSPLPFVPPMKPPSEFDWVKRPSQRIAFFEISEDDLKDRLRELAKDYSWTVVPLDKGTRGVIFYYKPNSYSAGIVTNPDSEYEFPCVSDVLMSVGLMVRALGVVPPNLSVTEWRELYFAFGYSKEEVETAVKRLLSKEKGDEPKVIDKIGEGIKLVCEGGPGSVGDVVHYLVKGNSKYVSNDT